MTVSVILENHSRSLLKNMELSVLDSLNTKMARPEGSSVHDGVPVPFQLPPGEPCQLLPPVGPWVTVPWVSPHGQQSWELWVAWYLLHLVPRDGAGYFQAKFGPPRAAVSTPISPVLVLGCPGLRLPIVSYHPSPARRLQRGPVRVQRSEHSHGAEAERHLVLHCQGKVKVPPLVAGPPASLLFFIAKVWPHPTPGGCATLGTPGPSASLLCPAAGRGRGHPGETGLQTTFQLQLVLADHAVLQVRPAAGGAAKGGTLAQLGGRDGPPLHLHTQPCMEEQANLIGSPHLHPGGARVQDLSSPSPLLPTVMPSLSCWSRGT